MDVDIEVKMHDVSAWKVNTTSFTLKVYAKDTTYCEYRTYPPEQRTYFSYTKFYDKTDLVPCSVYIYTEQQF